MIHLKNLKDSIDIGLQYRFVLIDDNAEFFGYH